MSFEQPFEVIADFLPTGDQPAAIEQIMQGLDSGMQFQTLEGVTGSGKTFTMANVIAKNNKPTLVISHNKTLAAQLYAELQTFLPKNAVSFFISYFDYYQPEAYIPRTDTFIEKDSSINEDIERLRLAATDNLLNRKDVVVVASVSCIYGLGSPEDYKNMMVSIKCGEEMDRDFMLEKLVAIQYTRNEMEKSPGTFRVLGDTVEVYPAYAEYGYRIGFFGDEIESIQHIETLTGNVERELDKLIISPAKHFVSTSENIDRALITIRAELEERVAFFEKENKLLEAQRCRMRTEYDMEILKELGFCSGIENYSRHLTGREEGARPYTLIDFLGDDFLTIIDESHVTIPQINGMYNGDRSRKEVLVEHGFRLPSALDNRPMRFEEFLEVTGQMVFVTATPGKYEQEHCKEMIPQLIRPTGIVDPLIEIRPLKSQIDDLIEEVHKTVEEKGRVLVTTLTKRSSEDLADYLKALNIRVRYLHSEIDALERVEILRSLRMNEFDVLIGINLLREGLDLPEVSLVAILDADKEGFLRSRTSLVQTAGRAARNTEGRVILYADTETDSIKALLKITKERREKQLAYNVAHNITPKTIVKEIQKSLYEKKLKGEDEFAMVKEGGKAYSAAELIDQLEQEMQDAAKSLEFERAAMIRDQLMELRSATSAGNTTKSSGGKKKRKVHKGATMKYPKHRKKMR